MEMSIKHVGEMNETVRGRGRESRVKPDLACDRQTVTDRATSPSRLFGYLRDAMVNAMPLSSTFEFIRLKSTQQLYPLLISTDVFILWPVSTYII